MSLYTASQIVYNMIGISVNFKYDEETVYVNEYITVTISKSFYIEKEGDSYYRITFNPLENFIPDFSSNIFDVKPRAKEFGIKLKGIIDDGEIFVNSSLNYIKITVCVYKSGGPFNFSGFKGSIVIKINFPEKDDDSQDFFSGRYFEYKANKLPKRDREFDDT